METNYRIIWTYDIKWDLDGNDIVNCYSSDGERLDIWEASLTFKIPMNQSDTKSDFQTILSDHISELSGWCHNGFSYDEFKNVYELVEEIGLEEVVLEHYYELFDQEYLLKISDMNPEFGFRRGLWYH